MVVAMFGVNGCNSFGVNLISSMVVAMWDGRM